MLDEDRLRDLYDRQSERDVPEPRDEDKAWEELQDQIERMESTEPKP